MNMPDPFIVISMIILPIVYSIVQILTELLKAIVGM